MSSYVARSDRSRLRQGGRFSPYPNLSPEGRGDHIVQILLPQQQKAHTAPNPFMAMAGMVQTLPIFSSTVSMFSPQQLFGSVGPSPFQGEGDRRFSSCRIISSTPPHYNQSRYARNAARSSPALKPASAPGIIGNCQLMLPTISSTTTRAEQQAKSRM